MTAKTVTKNEYLPQGAELFSEGTPEAWDKIYSKIKAAKRPVIVTHTRPDADAYGASLGLYALLKNSGIDCPVIDEDETHAKYKFIPNSQLVTKTIPADADLIILADCADPKRVGDSLKDIVISNLDKVICFDHHISNGGFGMLAIVESTACSTSEMIFKFGIYLEKKIGKTLISKECATCLFAGLYGDTGGFRYSSTGIAAFEMGAELMRRGVKPAEVAENYLGSKAWSQIKIQSEALLNATSLFGGKVVEITVPHALIHKNNGDWLDTEGLVEQARDVLGAEIGVSIGEDGNVTKVSLRSRANAIPVNTIAEEFGGGGHKNAAAFRSKKPLAEVQDALRKRLKEILGA